MQSMPPTLKKPEIKPLATFPVSWSFNDERFLSEAKTTLFAAEKRRLMRISRGRETLPTPVLNPWEQRELEDCSCYWLIHGIHEAGHAVVAFVLGFTPKFIRIKSLEWPFVTSSRYECVQKDSLWKELPESERGEFARCQVSMKAGGLAAQGIFLPPPLIRDGAESDFKEALDDWCKKLIGSKKDTDEWVRMLNATLRKATMRAEKIINEYREATLALAAESVSRSALSGKHVVEILNSHGVERNLKEWK